MLPEQKYTSAMYIGNHNLHVVFLPFLAPSHVIPLVHAARLFARRGIQSTIVSTSNTAIIFKTSIDLDIADGYPIAIHTIDTPSLEVVEPPKSSSRDMSLAIIPDMMELNPPMKKLIQELMPDCLFSDVFLPWTVDVAKELEIPRLLFYPFGFLYHSVFHSLKAYAPHVDVKSESEMFVVPGLPDEITMKRSQLTHHFKLETRMGEMLEKIQESEKQSYGLVYNTFYEIEPAYADHIKKIKGANIWHIGPVFQYFNGVWLSEKHQHSCLSWLVGQKPESVVYVCFGSMTRFPDAQIAEIAMALEESKQPFIWAVGKGGDEAAIGGLPEGFEERIGRENKGLIIRGWVPQVEILQQMAVGGFLTHCGWNSLLEAMVSGVPVITWPLFAEQFYNEKLVELLGIGVGVGAEVWNPGFEITSPIIKKHRIIKAIEGLTDGSDVAEGIRRNSKEVAMEAKQAVKEGGSSFNSLTALIEDIKAYKFAKNA